MAELQQRVHRCIRCLFVPSRDDFSVPENILEETLNNDHEPVFIGFFTLPGWSGHAAFYAFICSECDSFSMDNPHGCDLLYLSCQICRAGFNIGDPEIYIKEGRLIAQESFLSSIFEKIRKHMKRLSISTKHLKN